MRLQYTSSLVCGLCWPIREFGGQHKEDNGSSLPSLGTQKLRCRKSENLDLASADVVKGPGLNAVPVVIRGDLTSYALVLDGLCGVLQPRNKNYLIRAGA